MKKFNLRDLKKYKTQNFKVLTCYDYQTAQLLNQTDLAMILIGDSLGNVVLGYETTIPVTLEEMLIFSKAVKRGAPDKFLIADLPFGSYPNISIGLKNAVTLFKQSEVEALKLEGAFDYQLKLIKRLTENGIPVMGHIGLTPQSVHQMGGYYTHGKTQIEAERLKDQAFSLQAAGAFSLVLECVEEKVAQEITQSLEIPTIGIGSGPNTNGQILVINDLLQTGPGQIPNFCKPQINLFEIKKQAINAWIKTP